MRTFLGGIIRYLFLIAVISLYISGALYSDIDVFGHKQENSPEDLDDILNKCADYCERLARASLNFVCNERIEEERYEHFFRRYARNPSSRKVEENTYVYDYQLIKKGIKVEESRILLEENGKKVNERDAKLKAQMFYSKRSVFGPVGLLIRKNQDKYNYKTLNEETVNGRKTVIVEAKPITEMRDMPNYGKIWIDKEDYSILKIKVAEESLVGIEQVKGVINVGTDPVISVTHFYGEVYKTDKNQIIRFPSKTVFLYEKHLKERRFEGRIIEAKTQYTYYNYKFFTVDVEVKY
jgi:outer membrane lipoprotein-sorting protein